MAEWTCAQWSAAERRAWAWPDNIKPSEWAEKYRILPSHVTAEPGPWRNERTPYLAGIMDAVAERGVEGIVFCKAAQVGWSEALRNLLGFWIDREPGPCLLVMPDQKSAEELIEERVKPLLEFTPAVKRHLTSRAWDVTKSAIRLRTMSLYIGWAGSSQALKSRPIRYVLLDEIDEFVSVSGAGGDPISKALKRLTTYAAKGRARALLGGTPTTRLNNTWQKWEACPDKRHFFVPCPHCGRYQRLVWAHVKWPKLDDEPDRHRRAARIEAESLAYYECGDPECRGQITDGAKMQTIRRGVWVSDDQIVTPDGRVVGPSSRHKWVGFHLSALYSPWVSFSKLAAEFVAAEGDVQALCDFINQRLGEPFEEQRAKTEPSLIQQKAVGAAAPMQVPTWARALIATADTQGTDERDGYFYYVIRAWGCDYRSQLIDFGVCSSKSELKQRCLDRPIPMEGGRTVTPQMLIVDSGGPRWQEIYQFSQSDERIHPAKGASHRQRWMVEEKPQKRHGIVLWEIDTEQSKDLLHRLIHDSDRTKWSVHRDINDDYCRQLSAESKIYDPSKRQEVWVEIVKKSNHFWDCEHEQCAAAWRIGLGTPEPQASPKSPADPNDRPAGFVSGGNWQIKTW